MLIFLHIRPAISHMICDKFPTVMQLSHVACQERINSVATYAPSHMLSHAVTKKKHTISAPLWHPLSCHIHTHSYLERLCVALPAYALIAATDLRPNRQLLAGKSEPSNHASHWSIPMCCQSYEWDQLLIIAKLGFTNCTHTHLQTHGVGV